MGLAEKGKKVYDKIYPEIKNRAGQYVVIEVESEDFFVSKDFITAYNYAKARFPDKQFYFVQIGKDVGAEFK